MAKADKETIIGEILIELAKVGNSRGEVLAKVGKKWQLSERTFDRVWKIAQERHIETQSNIQSKLNDTLLDEKEGSLKSGLKSKLDRLLELQKQVEELNKELETNIMIVHTFSDGEIVTGMRPMNSIEKASINKTIKEIRAEISKIEGDYAPTKTANTDTQGNDIKPDLTKYTDEELRTIAELQRKGGISS